MDRLETCFKFIHRFTKNAINAIKNAKKLNSWVSNCIEVRKFWEYSTDLRTNISDRDQKFFEKFLSISFRIRIVSNRTTSISVEVYEYRHYLKLTGANQGENLFVY